MDPEINHKIFYPNLNTEIIDLENLMYLIFFKFVKKRFRNK